MFLALGDAPACAPEQEHDQDHQGHSSSTITIAKSHAIGTTGTTTIHRSACAIVTVWLLSAKPGCGPASCRTGISGVRIRTLPADYKIACALRRADTGMFPSAARTAAIASKASYTSNRISRATFAVERPKHTHRLAFDRPLIKDLNYAANVPAEGENPVRQWEVKKDYRWLWPIVYSVVGLAIMAVIMMLAGTR
jgi:hypothetical protein